MELILISLQVVSSNSRVLHVPNKVLFRKVPGGKAKNLATKQDIEEITSKIESVKAEIARTESVQQTKYQLKYQACLDALALTDAYLSHTLLPSTEQKITKQFMTTEQARACHSKLILSCENPKIVSKLTEILIGRQLNTRKASHLPTFLNEFRNMVRSELGFGPELELDREIAWFGYVICEPPPDQETNQSLPGTPVREHI